MTNKNDEVKQLLISLKRVSDLYRKANENQRGRLLQACQKLFDRGEGLGVDRVWLETLVVSGKDFLDSLEVSEWTKDSTLNDVAEVIFN